MTPEMLTRIKKLVRHYYFTFKIRAPFEDVFHEVILSLLRTQYLERYDESKPLHNYLSGYVYNHFCKTYKREHYVANDTVSLFQDISTADNIELIDTIGQEAEDLESDLFVDQMYDYLLARFYFSTFIVYDTDLAVVGIYPNTEWDKYKNDVAFIIFPRCTGTVFKFLYAGLNQVEIANILNVSKSWISKIIKRLAEIKELKDYAYDKGYFRTIKQKAAIQVDTPDAPDIELPGAPADFSKLLD